mmetsp:Transcript_51125/g.76382  ORF Transcript_51125/g.76382 Transcript_51125/m.76382 type:complete len:81 (-) Transcript_51125:244-486(-)
MLFSRSKARIATTGAVVRIALAVVPSTVAGAWSALARAVTDDMPPLPDGALLVNDLDTTVAPLDNAVLANMVNVYVCLVR